MGTSVKYHHLNNIKTDLQDKKMTLLVTHHLLHRIKEQKIQRQLLFPCASLLFQIADLKLF